MMGMACELAIRVARAKGLGEADSVMRTSFPLRIVQEFVADSKRGRIVSLGKRRGVRLWEKVPE